MIFLLLGLAFELVARPPGAVAATPRPALRSTAMLVREARAAHGRGEKALFLSIYEELARRRPGDVFVLYTLACGQALNGRSQVAVSTLEQVLAHRVASDLDADPDFEALRATEGYRSVLARMNALRAERVTSGATRAFTIPEKGLVAEGIAFDPKTRSFFVSSIRRRKILRIEPGGRISDFATATRDGLRSALGMRIDPKRRTLWVASQAIPSMEGYRKNEPPAAAVFEYDLDSGLLRKEHVPPTSGDPPAFDDLTVAEDGTVFVNDASNPRIWTIPAGGTLRVFLASEDFGGTQGMALSGDGRTLYVSDYHGVFAVDLATRRVDSLPVPADLSLAGIDGLAFFANGLVAIQNGILPHRVVRIDLGPGGRTIARARILEMNHPDFDEPTLGVVAEGSFYFSADSQGQKFLDESHPISPEAMRETVILKVPLEGARSAR